RTPRRPRSSQVQRWQSGIAWAHCGSKRFFAQSKKLKTQVETQRKTPDVGQTPWSARVPLDPHSGLEQTPFASVDGRPQTRGSAPTTYVIFTAFAMDAAARMPGRRGFRSAPNLC